MQEINFLNALPQEKIIKFSAKQMLQLVTFAIISLLALTAYQKFKLHQLENDYVQFKSQENETLRQLDLLTQQKPNTNELEQMKLDVDILQEEVQARTDLFQRFSNVKNNHPFSDYMLALARWVPQGIWLTEIDVNQDEKMMKMKGVSVHANEIPLMFEKLGQAQALKGKSFRVFQIWKSGDQTQFEMSTKKHRAKNDIEKVARKLK